VHKRRDTVYIRTMVCTWGYHRYGYEEDMRTIAEVMILEAALWCSEVGYQIGGDLIVFRGNKAAVMKVYSPIIDDGGTIGIGELKRLKGMGWCKKKTKMAAAGSILNCNKRESIPLETLIPTHSRVSCEIFLYSRVKIGTIFQPQKQEHIFGFPAGNFKILRISEENYALLYFTEK